MYFLLDNCPLVRAFSIRIYTLVHTWPQPIVVDTNVGLVSTFEHTKLLLVLGIV